MKAASAGMIAHLAQEVTTLAWCWKVTRRDAQVYGFTTHDRDLVIGGVTYAANTGLSASAAQARAGASVDNMDVSGMLDSAVITADDLRAGLWDGAEIDISLVNWSDTSQSIRVQTGQIGNISLRNNQFTAEMRSLAQALQQTTGRTLTRRCDATLGDTRCGVSMAAWTVSGSVTGVTSRQVFDASDLPALAGGKLTWQTGANAGWNTEIAAAAAGSITLALPMPYDIAIGDTYDAEAGCDKNLSTCRDTYANVARFRGFPNLPGPDKVMAYPDAN